MGLYHIAKDTYFDTSSDSLFQFEMYNAMLGNAGEQTLPLTLPPTPKNMRLVEWGNRMDASYKPIADISVIVMDGVFIIPANLSIDTCDEDDGIVCTLYLGTGEFYSRVGETKVAALTWPVYQAPEGGTLETNVEYLIDILKTSDPGNIFVVCPVLTTHEYVQRIVRNPWYPVPTDENVDSILILNWYEQYQHYLDLETGGDILTLHQGEFTQQIVEDGSIINIGKGYGMTPFIKLSYALNNIFESYGYSFDFDNIKDVLNEASGMFIMNNVADAIYSGVLRFAQLLPDMTIKNFIAELEKWFCGKFIFSSLTNKVIFHFFKDTENHTPTNLTSYVIGKSKIQSFNFTKKVLNINDSYKNVNDEDVEVIDFVFPDKKRVDAEFMWDGVGSKGYTTYRFEMLQVESIVHKNSSVSDDDQSGESDTSTELQLGYYSGTIISADPSTVGYATSNPLFVTMDSTRAAINSIYARYLTFLSSSNIPFIIPIRIPPHIILGIDLYKPIFINNQRLLIEKIQFSLNEDEEQTITVRSLRTLLDRP